MAQKPKLRTHTHMDISLVEEMQHVVDRVLVPNCIRKTQAFYLGIGVLCLGIGAGSVLASGQLVVGAIFGLLGLATKAGKVQSGEFSTEKAVKSGRAFLVIVSEDASDNTKKMFRNMCTYYKVPYFEFGGREELGAAMGKQMRVSLAVLDEGFSNALRKQMC